MRRFLTGCRVFTGESVVSGRGVLIADGRIEGLLPADATPEGAEKTALPEGSLLVPGFLDLQVNGAGGVLFNETPTAEAARRIAAAVRPFGVTGVLPTFITDERTGMAAACDAVAEATAGAGSGVLGIHLEGPFISVERRGVHNPASVRTPDEADIAALDGLAQKLDGHECRVLLTLAPEHVDDRAIARLAGSGIILSVGHTAASFERVEEAMRQGMRGFTHTGNAMPPIVNRAPGPVAAALASRDAWCGLIADGHHVHPGLMRVMAAAKAPGKLFLVTDAMPPVGTEAKSFVLYGNTILRQGGRLTTADGVLAGADIGMADAVRNCVGMLGLSLTEALRMASLYPAAFVRLDHRYGRIAPGYKADFALITDAVDVLETWVEGARVWRKR